METIGLIAAMSQESAALLRCVGKRERTRLGLFRGFRFQLAGRDCLLVTSGMGLEHAAQATRALLGAVTPKFFVSFGIAGAVHADLNIGDVVNARNACLLEQGVPGLLLPLKALTETAWKAAAQALQPRGARLLQGTAITTRGSQVTPQQAGELPNPVLEMETIGIARVASEKGIPLISLRAISDGPQAPIPLDLEAMMDEEYHYRIGEMIKIILRRPQILLQSRQMIQNSGKAADNAAIALVAALSQI